MSKHNSEKSLLSFNSTPSRFSKTQMQNLVFFLLMTITACFLFWKCRYGFCDKDEAFLLAIPYRLLKGDALLQHEWCIAQLSGFLTYPFVWIYVELTGGTEGIALTMRYLCTLIQCLTGIFLYIRLNHINWLGACVAAISFSLYTPFGIMSLSYNSIAIIALVLSQTIILTSKKNIYLQYILAGFFFAAAVLCCPYLIAVYLLYLIIVFVFHFSHNHNLRDQMPILSIKGAFSFTVGAAFLAFIFALFVFSRASLSKIITSIPYMLAEPDHPDTSIIKKTLHFVLSTVFENSWTKNLYIIFFSLALICVLDKKRKQHRHFFVLPIAICVLLLMYSFYKQNNYLNHLMWSINVLAFFLILLSPSRKTIALFCIFWLPGMLYAYCLNLSSNQLFYAISSASTVSLVGSLMITAIFLSELKEISQCKSIRSLSQCLLCLIFVVQLCMQASLRYHSICWEWENAMQKQTMYIKDGSNAGLIVTPEKYDLYYDYLDIVQLVEKDSAEKVLYLTQNICVYLDSTLEVAGYSPWLHHMQSYTLDTLDAYYKINPDKMPDIVHVDAEYPYAAEQFCQMFHYNMQSTPYGFLLTPQ